MTVEVVYPGPYAAVSLPDGTVLEKDKPTAVSAAVAKNLIRQGFKRARSENGGSGN